MDGKLIHGLTEESSRGHISSRGLGIEDVRLVIVNIEESPLTPRILRGTRRRKTRKITRL